MLEPDQWDRVLSHARGTIYRNTERISSNALLNLLEVGLPAGGCRLPHWRRAMRFPPSPIVESLRKPAA